MGGNRELMDGKIWEWDLSFRWEWEWDGNGNEVIEMGGNWYEKSVPAHLYLKASNPRPSESQVQRPNDRATGPHKTSDTGENDGEKFLQQ